MGGLGCVKWDGVAGVVMEGGGLALWEDVLRFASTVTFLTSGADFGKGILCAVVQQWCACVGAGDEHAFKVRSVARG